MTNKDNIVSAIKALRHQLTSEGALVQMIRNATLTNKLSAIDDMCSLALKYMICGYEHKAARCYLYASILSKQILVSSFVSVTFSITKEQAKQASQVAVVGDFNNWNKNSNIMTKTYKGFETTIKLECSKTYEFKYVLNNDTWITPPSYKTVYDGYNGKNAVIKV